MLDSPGFTTVSRVALEATRSRRTAYLLLVPLLAGVVLVLLPSLSLKLAAVVGLAGVAVAVLMARRGMALDPAWVVVGQLYLLIPVGSLLRDWGTGFPVITALVLAFMPFVLATLVGVPATRPSVLLLAPLALLGLVAAASVIWSPAADYGMEKLTIWLVNGLLPAMTVVVLYAAKGSISWRIILLAAVIYALGLLLIGAPWSEGGQRLTVFDQNPIWAARAILVGALVSALGPFPLGVKVVTVPLLLLAGLLTQSLGPLVGVAVGVLAGTVTALALASRREGRPSPGWTVLLIGMGFAVVIVLSGVLDSVLAPMLNDPNVTARSGYIDVSASLFLGSPLYGVGIGGFLSTGVVAYPHNLVIEIAVELGLTGLISLCVWVALAMLGASRSPVVAGLVVGTATFTLFSGSLASQTEFWLFSALGVALVPAAVKARRAARRLVPPPGMAVASGDAKISPRP